MGYRTCLHLVDVKIKVESVSLVRRKLSRRKSSNKDPLRFFFERAVLDSDNFLMFKASDDGLDAYEPFDRKFTICDECSSGYKVLIEKELYDLGYTFSCAYT